jgi:hypothetical protein
MNTFTRTLSLTLSSFAFVAAAAAQTPLQVRGEINQGTGGGAGCYWCTGAPFVLKFTGTTVQSTTVNLNTFLGQKVLIDGVWNGSVLQANAVQVTTETFSMGGNPSIGGTMRFTTETAPGTLALNMGALGTSFLVPVGSIAVLLDPASLVPLAAGFTNAVGDFRTEINLPNLPSLIGMRVFGQSVIAPAGAPLFASNIDAVEIQ